MSSTQRTKPGTVRISDFFFCSSKQEVSSEPEVEEVYFNIYVGRPSGGNIQSVRGGFIGVYGQTAEWLNCVDGLFLSCRLQLVSKRNRAFQLKKMCWKKLVWQYNMSFTYLKFASKKLLCNWFRLLPADPVYNSAFTPFDTKLYFFQSTVVSSNFFSIPSWSPLAWSMYVETG